MFHAGPRHKENGAVRSKHDNVTFLERVHRESTSPARATPLLRKLRPHSPADARSLRLEGESHPEFPLERLCSHLYEPFQLTFARNAQQHFAAREDVEVVASHQGLMIRGETEDSIEAATVVLKDLYGSDLRIGAPRIRYHLGRSLEQPWMGLRVRCKPGYLDAVNADLMDRKATIVNCDVDSAQCIIQARAPLASILGYRLALEMITSGTAQHAIWLSHYAPVESTPPDGEAA
jgi:hypothetical protein